MRKLKAVPPAPEVNAFLLSEYQNKWKALGFSYQQYLIAKGYQNLSHSTVGLDNSRAYDDTNDDIKKISIPRKRIEGVLNVIVLLVDFPDLQGTLSKDYYENLLFSQNSQHTVSMADYYTEVSRGKVDIRGEIHGWFRMPQDYNYYTNGNSGMSDSYPRDARGLAEDAVNAAISKGVNFNNNLDVLGEGVITALFIVHAGMGAEKLQPPISGDHIWSHKWEMKKPIKISSNLMATKYLMVPQQALLGVCAHELGHLAFQWDDFYDDNYDEDKDYWDGNGMWDLMASGSYAGRELRPVHPAGLHKQQHGWVEVEEIKESKTNISLDPITRAEGKVLKIIGPGYNKQQYLLLENRAKEKLDRELPGEGLLIWRIDERFGNESSKLPGMYLIQADGRNDLANPYDILAGDPGDVFPGTRNRKELLESGDISTSFPDNPSGVSIKNIAYDQETKKISLDVIIESR